MDKNTAQLTQLLLDRIVELEKRNATIENILDKVVDRLDDLDGRGIYGWPRQRPSLVLTETSEMSQEA